MNTIIAPAALGVTQGMILVLVASGLTLTFGSMRLINMAHGGFFMFAAFTMATVSALLPRGTVGFAASIGIATASTAVLGVIAERFLYRRMYGLDHMSGLLATFALMLVFQGAIELGWGVNPRLVTLPAALVGSVRIGGVNVPLYEVIIIPVALAILGLLGMMLYLTRLGLATRCSAFDRTMVALLGTNVTRTSSVTFAFGCILAGLGGALISPLILLTSDLGTTYIVLAFIVVLIGGMGSVAGTLIGGLLVGLVNAFLAIDYPQASSYGLYILLFGVLLVRPAGLLGGKLTTGELY